MPHVSEEGWHSREARTGRATVPGRPGGARRRPRRLQLYNDIPESHEQGARRFGTHLSLVWPSCFACKASAGSARKHNDTNKMGATNSFVNAAPAPPGAGYHSSWTPSALRLTLGARMLLYKHVIAMLHRKRQHALGPAWPFRSPAAVCNNRPPDLAGALRCAHCSISARVDWGRHLLCVCWRMSGASAGGSSVWGC